jgi:transcriptional regulator with XRE-family HTH domain
VEIKNILRRLVKDRGITITHLSRSTHVPVQTLHGWIHGSEPKSIRQVKAVADYFEVDLDYICFGISPEKEILTELENEINAGIFEVILRKVKP